ncbi:DUF3857 domain-containing transglutaminase family protein [Mucilaginibacter sp.]|jgi:hypothetical protein|uniref:DUF3857 domain-containing transglutaminase family protein n=1 Tax=Mucilaginibacter sp. TaxID=1882438 RepID=UPI003563A404
MKHWYIKSWLCAAALLATFNVYAQDKKVTKDLYIATGIPDSLKDEANAVVRYSSDELIVKGPGRVTEKHHSIVTVLNEKGDDEARLILYYDKKYNSVNSVEMIVYNAAGVQLKKYRKSDMYDRSAADGMSIITDYRLLALGHTIASYPATIEVIYETSKNSYLDLGDWNIQEPEKSIQYAEYKVSIVPSIGFRFKNKNTGIKPEKTVTDGMEKYTWKVQNIKAVKPEEDALAWQVFPKISFAANSFLFDGMPGDISNWQNYGKWQQALNTDVNSLSPQRVEEIKTMTAGIKSDKEKAKFLYEYLQQNTRYVSIQLGIGGLKPFPASFVDQKKYGDCKALANYMCALLKAVNIPSYYAMVRAGTNAEPADPSFPTDPFNHIILCVPFKSDTTWLECTSSTQPFGKLGPFTENRNALLITENGGKLVNTPKSTGIDNQFNSEVRLILNADGSAKVKAKILSTGEYRSDYIGIASFKADEQKEYLIRTLNIKQPSAFEYNTGADKDGVKEVTLELEFDKFCDIIAGNKQFYRPRLFDLWKTTLPVLEKRKTDFYFNQPMQKACITTIELPEGFEVETLPVNQSLKFSYGNYEITYTYNAAKNQVISTAKFNLINQAIPAAKYVEMQVYMDNIAKAQNKKLVIRRKA